MTIEFCTSFSGANRILVFGCGKLLLFELKRKTEIGGWGG